VWDGTLVAPFTLTLKYTIKFWPEIRMVLPYLLAVVALWIGFRLVVRAYTHMFQIAERPIRGAWRVIKQSTAYCRNSLAKRPQSAGASNRQGEGSRSTHSERIETYKQPSKVTPYEILGVQPGASREEIKAAYRTAMLKNHPDKVAHLDPVLQELAAKRSQDITAAFSSLSG
jgi:hypothetical protein